MLNHVIQLFTWINGAFVMLIVFGLVILSLVGAIYMMASEDK